MGRTVPDTAVFTRAEALARGWTDAALTRAVGSGRARPTATGVAAIDAGLHRDLVTADELYEVIRRCWN